MTVYVYRRDDGSTFEVEQRMTADALLSCPATGQGVERVLQPFAPRYTGTGFYSTDHRKAGPDEKTRETSPRGPMSREATCGARAAKVGPGPIPGGR